jgi:hypothetical protein
MVDTPHKALHFDLILILKNVTQCVTQHFTAREEICPVS